jgi:hypothetical protein
MESGNAGVRLALSARFSITLFVLVLFVYLVSGPPLLGYDGDMMYRVSESLVLRHSFQVTDPTYHISQPYAPYGLGTSLLLLPLVALGNLALHDPRALIILYLPVITALTVVALSWLFLELGITRRRSLWLCLIFAFATLAWHYASVLFSEQLVALAIVVSLLGLLSFRRTGRRRWLATAGGALGLAILAREDSAALVVVPFAFYLLWLVLRGHGARGEKLLALASFGGPLLLGAAVALGYDVLRYGRPLAGPYMAAWAWFGTPIQKGVFGLLLSPGVGLLVLVPVLLLSPIGFGDFFRRWRAEATLVAALILVRLAFYGTWYDWSGGSTLGPRYLLPIIPLLMLPLGFIVGRVWIRILIGLAAAGLAIELLEQLVPYGLYYGLVVPPIASHLGLCHCVPGPGPERVGVDDVIRFDWASSALVVQTRLLLQGIIAPVWRPIAFIIPPVLTVDAILLRHLLRAAGRLDRRGLGERQAAA